MYCLGQLLILISLQIYEEPWKKYPHLWNGTENLVGLEIAIDELKKIQLVSLLRFYSMEFLFSFFLLLKLMSNIVWLLLGQVFICPGTMNYISRDKVVEQLLPCQPYYRYLEIFLRWNLTHFFEKKNIWIGCTAEFATFLLLIWMHSIICNFWRANRSFFA